MAAKSPFTMGGNAEDPNPGSYNPKSGLIPRHPAADPHSNNNSTGVHVGGVNVITGGMVLDNSEITLDKGYPSPVKSFFAYVHEGYKENRYLILLHDFFGESLGSFWKFLPIIYVMGLVRADSGLVAQYFVQLPIIFTAFFATLVTHVLFWHLSCDFNVSITITRFFLPDMWVRPTRFSTNGYGYSNTAPMMWWYDFCSTFVKMVGNFAGVTLAVAVATWLEPTGLLGFPNGGGDYTSSGFPFFYADNSLKGGFILFLACMIDGLSWFSNNLEEYRHASAQTKSLYTAGGTALAYLLSYYTTSSPLNFFTMACAAMIHGKSGNQDWVAIIFSSFVGYLGAGIFWFWVHRLTYHANMVISMDRPPKQE